MKHAGAAALDALESVLARVRESGGLRERSRGVFYFKSKAFLHFHEDPAGLFADMRGPDGAFIRIRADGPEGAAAVLDAVRARLASD